MYEVASFKNFENCLTTAKVMTKTKVAPFYLGHGVDTVAGISCLSMTIIWKIIANRLLN